MSKASEYAKAVDSKPKNFAAGQFIVAAVTSRGRFEISATELSPADALRLRDWITENFDEAAPSKAHWVRCPLGDCDVFGLSDTEYVKNHVTVSAPINRWLPCDDKGVLIDE
jgi:hypothetical protein